MDLTAYREAALKTAPLLAAYLHADPVTIDAALDAYLNVQVRPPEFVPTPHPPAQWRCRPSYFSDQPTFVTRQGNGSWKVSTDPWSCGGVAFTARRGQHFERSRGHHTRHGRLNVEACATAWAAYLKQEGVHRAHYETFLRETSQELLSRAVRLGTGWILAKLDHYSYTPTYLIRDPEQGVWRNAEDFFYRYDDSDILEVVEQGPPARAPVPTMTWDEARTVVESFGCTLRISTHSDGDFGDIWWKEILVERLVADHGHPLTAIGDYKGRMPATRENLETWIRAGVAGALEGACARLEQAQGEVLTLLQFGRPAS